MNIQKQHIIELINKNKRTDGRKLNDYRKIIIEKDIVPKAEGSAKVTMGNTEVIVGIKMGVGEPFPDKENEGIIMTGAELSPLASPRFESGPPGIESIEIARVVDRGIRESKMIELDKLCIKKKEKVWMVFIDIHVLNHDGNLIDAAALAAVTALSNTRMPSYEKEKVIYEKKTKKLPVKLKPISVTVVKISDKLLIDPNLDEEDTMKARLTISMMDNGNICAMQKGGNALTEKEIFEAFDLASNKVKELRKLI